MLRFRSTVVLASALVITTCLDRGASRAGTPGEVGFEQPGVLGGDRLVKVALHALRIESSESGLTADDVRLSPGDWISLRCVVAVDRRGRVVDASVERLPDILRRRDRSWETVIDESISRVAAERLIETARAALAGATFRAPELPDGGTEEVAAGGVTLIWQAPIDGALPWGSAGIATGREGDLALFPLP
jgi:hypothetical protein